MELKRNILDIDGLKVGQAENSEAKTGVTVVLAEKGAVCGVDVRGAAPGTRETDLLDPVNAMLLKDVVKEQISKGKIVLFSSHQMNYIEEFCDSIAIINAGTVAVRGDLNEIKRTYPRDKLVARTQAPEKIKADLGEACTEREDGTLLIRMANPDEKQAMMKRLVENYDVDEVKVFEPSLNDIFVEYAGAQV